MNNIDSAWKKLLATITSAQDLMAAFERQNNINENTYDYVVNYIVDCAENIKRLDDCSRIIKIKPTKETLQPSRIYDNFLKPIEI